MASARCVAGHLPQIDITSMQIRSTGRGTDVRPSQQTRIRRDGSPADSLLLAHRCGKFSRADFVFDKDRNVYICPAGAELTHSGIIDQGRILPYRASAKDCGICKPKAKCTPAPARKVSRDIDEDVRDRVRALANTEAFQLSCRERKKVEIRFAHMKRILKLDRLRLRGLSGARDEVLLTATAQNLRRLAKLICKSPPPVAEYAA